MNQHLFFAHSGGPQGKAGQGSYDFVQWLRENLGEAFRIHAPVIEKPDAPSYQMWETMLDRELCSLNGDVFLIGHSLGGSVLAKYLSEKKCQFRTAGLFLVAAPWWGSGGWDANEFALNTDRQKLSLKQKLIHIYHCTDDSVVPFSHAKLYKKFFPDAFLHELTGNDHVFAEGLPLLVEHIRNININQNTKVRFEDDTNTGK
ncbi:MAG: alpha/beta hydrolase [Balneolaceae bacterium]|nr:alpha/beta hydrolase [Balneolaceae bacterium]